MKAVWTILGWWTAAAAAAGGAGMELELEVEGCSAVFVLLDALGADGAEAGAGDVPLTATPLALAASGAPEPDSGCMLAVLVGELTSMGSAGDGADIWISGVGTGTTRVGPGSWAPSATGRVRWEASVAAAMDTVGPRPLAGGRESVLVAIAVSCVAVGSGALSCPSLCGRAPRCGQVRAWMRWAMRRCLNKVRRCGEPTREGDFRGN